ncbi:bifunctional diguanylate cyclase/phosphodiesterase [Saccharospirillum mangrovi]|uniref:sensor domain-containing protein n=1 Tax=Saccharospirillum mangrovi TaxID=2161747 RepID=UPI0013B3EEB6|nr:sensor domain-containing diguanylate cyclase [Saccharospirillum mangrovi]
MPVLNSDYLTQLGDHHRLVTSAVDGQRLQVRLQRFSGDEETGFIVHVEADSDDRCLQQRLTPLFESSLDGIAFIGTDGNYQLANPAFLDMLGRSADAVIGQPFTDFITADHLAGNTAELQRRLMAGEMDGLFEIHYNHADGHWVPASIRPVLITDADGNPEGVWSISRDSTLRNQLIESLTSSERRFRALFRNSLDAIAFWTENRQLRYANQACLDMTGYSREELSHLSFTDLLSPEWEDTALEFDRQLKERGYTDVIETDILRKDGEVVPISIRASAFRDNKGEVNGSWFILRDISGYKQALNQLRHSQNMLQQTNRMARIGGWEYDSLSKTFTFTDETYRILAIPQTYDRSLDSILKLFNPGSQKRLLHEVARTNDSGQPADFDVRLDGFEPARWLRISAQTAIDSSDRTYVVGAIQDISEFKARQRSLENDRDTFQHLAFHDPLTGLPNRLLLEDRFQQLSFTAQRRSGHVAILVIDLDDFKVINDQRGHPAGDALLRAIGDRLRNCVRQSDTVARLGGDEFIVLASLDSAEEVETIATKLFNELQLPIDWNGQQLNSHCSMGVAVYPHQGGDFNSLYEAADQAMYQAKAGGKNRYLAFVPS